MGRPLTVITISAARKFRPDSREVEVVAAAGVEVEVAAVAGVVAEVGVRWLRPPLPFDKPNNHHPGPRPARWAAPQY